MTQPYFFNPDKLSSVEICLMKDILDNKFKVNCTLNLKNFPSNYYSLKSIYDYFYSLYGKAFKDLFKTEKDLFYTIKAYWDNE